MVKFANCHDSLLAHHTFASHLPQRLDHVVSCYADSSPWKIKYGKRGDEEKGLAPAEMSTEDLQSYGAADARLTYLAWSRLQDDLEPHADVYEHDRKLAGICREMSRTGINVDHARKAELSLALEERRRDLRNQLQTVTGQADFNPGKLDAVRRYLFEDQGIRFVGLTKAGRPSTNTATLEALRLSNHTIHREFAEALLLWRLTGKVKSTYLDAIVPYKDGRARFNWKPFGTVSGRLSSRFQSQPRYKKTTPEARIREIYVPDSPDEVFIYYDVSQAEMRLAAYLSADPVFIKACEGDVHSNNAAAVFPERAHLRSSPDDWKPLRDISKNLGFAISYCAEVDKVFMTLRSKGFNVSRAAVELILNKLHAAYRTYYQWVESNLSRTRRTGHMFSPFLQRIRWLGWYPKITDVANFPIQSGLADIMNERTIALDERLPKAVKLKAQVHDACVYSAPRRLAEDAKEIISSIWAQPIDTPGGKLILPIDLKIGERLSEF